MADRPQRIQRKRTKGWSLPPGAVCVDRSTRFGNPWAIIKQPRPGDSPLWAVTWQGAGDAPVCTDRTVCAYENTARKLATDWYGDWLDGELSSRGVHEDYWERARRRILDSIPLLHGKDLACWCAIPEPGERDHCHGAVLLRRANPEVFANA